MNKKGLVGSEVAIAQIIRSTTFPSLYMACWGASALFDVSFTEANLAPFMVRLKDRSKIMQKSQDLCGIAAKGDIFKLIGGLCLISSHLISLAQPSLTRSSALFRQAVAAFLVCAEGCAALLMAASIRSLDHGSPQYTGHPLVAHFNNIFAAGCLSTSLQGNMRPCTLFGNLLCVGVSGSAFACFLSGVAVGCCKGVLRFTPKTDCKWPKFGRLGLRCGAGLAFEQCCLGYLVQNIIVIMIVREGLCLMVNYVLI